MIFGFLILLLLILVVVGVPLDNPVVAGVLLAIAAIVFACLN